MVNNIKKINLYIISLSLLFVFMIVATASIPCGNFDFKNLDSWFDFIKINFLSIICFCMLIYSYYSYKNFQDSLKGATQIPFEIRKIESINYEHLTFLTTYVVPLISFDFNKTRQIVILFLLLIAIGAIYIKTDLFYANPSLALLGFQIYKADGNFKNGDRIGIILISREKLTPGQKVSYIKLDNRIYYVKGNSL